MTWTYYTSQINTASTNASLMRVRWLVQDVSTADKLLQNEEIQWVLSDYSNVYEAAAVAARTIGARFAQRASAKTVQDATISWAQARANQYFQLAEQLAAVANNPTNRSIGIYAGGISKADKDANVSDSDWARPAFAVGLHADSYSDDVDWIQAST